MPVWRDDNSAGPRWESPPASIAVGTGTADMSSSSVLTTTIRRSLGTDHIGRRSYGPFANAGPRPRAIPSLHDIDAPRHVRREGEPCAHGIRHRAERAAW